MTPTQKRGPSMPPPGSKKPGLAVAIAVKPAKDKATSPDDAASSDDAGKAPPEDAVVIRAGKECHMCRNYAPESGKCSEVSGYFDPEDQCIRYFVAIAGAKDDEESEEGDEG